MKEQIEYYKRQIYQRNNVSAIHHLARLKHPDAMDALIEITQSDSVNERIQQAVLPILIDTGDKRIADIVVERFSTQYATTYSILRHIHKLNDRRVVPAMLTTLQNIAKIRERGRYAIVSETIASLSQLEDERAIPILKNLVETYPFESTEQIVPDEVYGILAIDALQSFDSEEAQMLYDKWNARLEAHIAYHLEQDTIFRNMTRKVSINRIIITRPMVIQNLLERLETGTKIEQLAIIQEIGLKAFPLRSYPDIKEQVIGAFICLAESHDDKDIRYAIIRRLSHNQDERMIPFALTALDDPRLRTFAVKILHNHEYTDAAPKIISMLDADIPNSYEAQFYQHYLGMVDTKEAEQAIMRFIERTKSAADVAEAYKVLGKMARHSDDALDFIIAAIDEEDINIQKVAIAALNPTGERALGVLISLLQADYIRRVAAIRALAARHYADAVPHLMQVLLNTRYGTSSLILRTLQTIGTEAAFSAINAWETRNQGIS